MTKIRIDPYSLTVTAWGHAGWSDTGQDIVCAAASMLMYTLAEFAKMHGGVAEEKEGYMHVEFPEGESAYRIGGFDALCEGLRMLADEYPNNVEIM